MGFIMVLWPLFNYIRSSAGESTILPHILSTAVVFGPPKKDKRAELAAQGQDHDVRLVDDLGVPAGCSVEKSGVLGVFRGILGRF